MLTPRKHGPSLKNSLVDAAAHYKGMLENRLLADPDHGVDYLKRTLRPFFIKDNQHVFLSRFLQLFRQWRGSREMVTWIGRFEITMRSLQNAWMDLHRDLPAPQSVEFTNTPNLAQRQETAALDAEDRPDAVQQIWNQRTEAARQQHQAAVPLPGNLIAMIFIAQADLTEQQRERLVSAMNAQNIPMEDYKYQAVKTQFLQLFCVSRTSISDPQLQHRPSGRRRRTYYIEEHGTMDGEEGYWVADETSGEQGVIALYDEDHFLVLKADGQGYRRRKIRGRKFGKGKGKGKGRKRPGFRPRGQGKGFSHIAEEHEDPDSSFLGKGKEKRGNKSYTPQWQ